MIKNRGPENTNIITKHINNYEIVMGFHRLKINDTSDDGNQPFIIETSNYYLSVFLNGEIYNYEELKQKYNMDTKSNSDCEVVLHLFDKHFSGELEIKDLVNSLDGVFAGCCVYHNKTNNKLVVVSFRDRYGVRPLYYGNNESLEYGYSSELKGLNGLVGNISQFKPGTFQVLELDNEPLNNSVISYPYYSYYFPTKDMEYEYILKNIRDTFENSVAKRMMSERPLCCLLSGGLDSSLVASTLAKLSTKKIHTFCVGMEGGEDFKYAQMVADHIGSIHHEIKLSEKEFIDAIPEVVRIIETYDGTTCRASVGQYLVSKYIKENTDFKVVYVGEGSDELTGGYLYFHNAPDEKSFDNECKRLLRDIHYFDGKRSDRAVSHFGLETRVPFLDTKFIEFYLSIDPKIRHHNKNMEKHLLRSAFDKKHGYDYLPEEVLWRKKEAFSDGVSSLKKSWYEIIQDFVKTQIGDEFINNSTKYAYYLMPYNEELYYYRKIFDSYYGGDSNNDLLIPYFWLPKWSGNISEASARVLDTYKDKI